MNTLQNNCEDCTVFKAAKHRTRKHLWCVLLALMCGHTALALDINQANEAELDSVKGMGPSLSAKVLTARSQGPFKDWSDLMQRVSGIRQHKAKQFSDQGLTVGSQAFNAKP
jgi:competence protein ComEA